MSHLPGRANWQWQHGYSHEMDRQPAKVGHYVAAAQPSEDKWSLVGWAIEGGSFLLRTYPDGTWTAERPHGYGLLEQAQEPRQAPAGSIRESGVRVTQGGNGVSPQMESSRWRLVSHLRRTWENRWRALVARAKGARRVGNWPNGAEIRR